jgi:hypothetical protein
MLHNVRGETGTRKLLKCTPGLQESEGCEEQPLESGWQLDMPLTICAVLSLLASLAIVQALHLVGALFGYLLLCVQYKN